MPTLVATRAPFPAELRADSALEGACRGRLCDPGLVQRL